MATRQNKETVTLGKLHVLEALQHALRKKYMATGDENAAAELRGQLKAVAEQLEVHGCALKLAWTKSGRRKLATKAEAAACEEAGCHLRNIRSAGSAPEMSAATKQLLAALGTGSAEAPPIW